MQKYEVQLLPEFLPAKTGRLFCIYFKSLCTDPSDRIVVFLQPIAEEMNKSRAVISKQARSLASIGIDSVVFDLFGTGDSSGKFSDANLDIWRENLLDICNWLVDHKNKKIHFVALRTGVFLLENLFDKFDARDSSIVLWNPVTNGALYWRQFVRLKVVSQKLTGSDSVLNFSEILQRDGKIEIAGYELSESMTSSIIKAKLDYIDVEKFKKILWIDVLTPQSNIISLVSKKITEEWKARGLNLELKSILGACFWTTSEITHVPELYDVTSGFFSEIEFQKQ